MCSVLRPEQIEAYNESPEGEIMDGQVDAVDGLGRGSAVEEKLGASGRR